MSTQCVNIEKQGMLSILGSDSDQRTLKTAAASIKRTLSADMSSKKWLSKNSPMKKIASSENLLAISSVVESDSSSSSDGELEDKQLNKDQPKTFDGWISILSKKNDQDSPNNVPPPYIHPLVKRSNSTLTKKSLEICTESLGSETGSDCFNSSPSSENEEQQQYSSVPQTSEDFHVVKYNNTKRLSSPRSFPPPLPSVHMQSRRQDGRLILEAVSVPPTNYFNAQRLDGRLLLTYIDQNNECELEIMENRGGEVGEFEQVFDDIQEVDDHERTLSDNDGDDEDEFKDEDDDDDKEEKEDVERKGMCIVMEQSPRLSNEVIVVFDNGTLVSHRFNNSINSMMDDNIVRQCYTRPSSVRQSPRRVAQVIPAPPPPPPPPPAAAASFNTYEYFWRKKPVVNNPIIIDDKCNKNNYYNNKEVEANGTDLKANCTTNKQDLVVIRENKASMNNNNLVPLLRSCKEPRRSLIIREPYCIATS